MNVRKHPLNSIWRGMWRRCTNPNAPQYEDYGGRGISVCERWKDFWSFVEDMGPKPDKFTIDRIDNDGDYTPENCRWLSRADQLLNRRNTIWVTIEGERYLAHELAKQCGHKSLTIRERAERGMTLDEVTFSGRYTSAVVAPAVAARVARQRAKTHCKHGHEFTEENTIWNPSGSRSCRECGRRNLRESRARARRKRDV